MEIKIKQNTQQFENGGLKTHILEGSNISYEFVYYENRERFSILRKSLVFDYNFDIGIPFAWFNEEKEISEFDPGHFLLITYLNSEGLEASVVCKDCLVYITNKGQTIDFIKS